MSTQFLSTTTVLFLALASIGNAYAKGQANPHQRALNRCNLTAIVAAEKLKAEFNAVDRNQNGSLDRNETAAVQIAARCFRHLDTNMDGKLSAVELQHVS